MGQRDAGRHEMKGEEGRKMHIRPTQTREFTRGNATARGTVE